MCDLNNLFFASYVFGVKEFIGTKPNLVEYADDLEITNFTHFQ